MEHPYYQPREALQHRDERPNQYYKPVHPPFRGNDRPRAHPRDQEEGDNKADKFYRDYQQHRERDDHFQREHRPYYAAGGYGARPQSHKHYEHKRFEFNQHAAAGHERDNPRAGYEFERYRVGAPVGGDRQGIDFYRPPPAQDHIRHNPLAGEHHIRHEPLYEFEGRQNPYRGGARYPDALPPRGAHFQGRGLPRFKSYERLPEETNFERVSGTIFDSNFRVRPYISRREERRYDDGHIDHITYLKEFYRDRVDRKPEPRRQSYENSKPDEAPKEERKETPGERKEEVKHKEKEEDHKEGFRYNRQHYQPYIQERQRYSDGQYGRRYEEHVRGGYKPKDDYNLEHRYKHEGAKVSSRHQIEHHAQPKLYGGRHQRVEKVERYQGHHDKYYSPYELELRGGGEFHPRHNYNYDHRPSNGEYLPYNRYIGGRDFERARVGDIRDYDRHHKDYRGGNRKYFRFEDRKEHHERQERKSDDPIIKDEDPKKEEAEDKDDNLIDELKADVNKKEGQDKKE